MPIRVPAAALACMTAALWCAVPAPAQAAPFFFSTGDVNGQMASASRPSSAGKIEIETGDDFVLVSPTLISGATFTGLITAGAVASDITALNVEIYRVFPQDSTNPPSGNVPTRTNSPSDVALDTRESAGGQLTFSTTVLSPDFSVGNSVLNGINKIPNQTTLGEGAVRGTELMLSVNFTTPFSLAPGHYFFVPQVGMPGTEQFYWLSSVRPIVAPGTPFAPDLQAWVRNENLSPDWLRIGTDIVGGATPPTFNMAFTLTGTEVPEPASLSLLGLGLLGTAAARRLGRGRLIGRQRG